MGRHAPPQRVAREAVFAGRLIQVFLDRIRLANGSEATREVVHHGGAVVMVPVTDQGEILFVRQHRYATGETLLELPAGGIDEGEEPLACAQRELQEEIGYRATRLVKLTEFYSAPGFCTELLHLFLASGLTPSTLPADDDEDLETIPLRLQAALAKVTAGEIRDAKTLAGVLLYARAATAGTEGAGGGGA